MEVESILQKLNQELLQASNPKQLEVIKLNYLGRSGIINDLAQKIKEIKPEQRSEFG